MPDKELSHRGLAGHDVGYLLGSSPFLRQIPSRIHAERCDEPFVVSDNMNKFGEHLRGKSEPIACSNQCGDSGPCC